MPKDEQNSDDMVERFYSRIKYRSSLIYELERLAQRERDLRKEIIENKIKENKERNTLSKQYKLIRRLKETRKPIIAKMIEIDDKVDKVNKALKEFQNKVPTKSEKILTEKLEKIEWDLQTMSLTRDEEKQLVGYIKKLEFELYLWKKAYEMRQELNALLSEVNSLKSKLDEVDEANSSLLIELKNRKKMLDKIIMIKQQLLKEDNEIKQDVVELKEILNHVQAEIFQKKQRLLKVARSKVKDKVSKGKSLSWDELKILFEEDKSESFK
ncbi:MAG: hypothetical protein L6N96_00515 [Candidatus Methylarchaceae archaeon HK02M2]|nr:hypothetical protein [Candidatus Methylarchaceae archaeon HK02M2]